MNTLPVIESELQRRLRPSNRPEIKTGDRFPFLEHVPQIVCRSGLKFSMQASEFHYCTPRDSFGPWFEVEIGFPSVAVQSLIPYAEESDDPTGTVYPYVPLDVVCSVVMDNGGLA